MRLFYKTFDRLRQRTRRRTWEADLAAGRMGEDLAFRYLQARGFTVVARNFVTRSRTAEVDLIGWDGAALVFVEVKTRRSEEYGSPDRAVDLEKQERIMRGAAEYLRRTDQGWDVARFDLVNVVLGPPTSIRHVEDAFSRRRSY